DAAQRVFNGVLGRYDFQLGRIDFVQGREERHGFARTGWSGMQNHSVWNLNDAPIYLDVIRREPQRDQRQVRLGLVQNSHHRRLAVVHGGDRNAQVQVESAVEFLENDASVLRNTALGDVQVAHDFQARHQRAVDMLRQA